MKECFVIKMENKFRDQIMATDPLPLKISNCDDTSFMGVGIANDLELPFEVPTDYNTTTTLQTMLKANLIKDGKVKCAVTLKTCSKPDSIYTKNLYMMCDVSNICQFQHGDDEITVKNIIVNPYNDCKEGCHILMGINDIEIYEYAYIKDTNNKFTEQTFKFADEAKNKLKTILFFLCSGHNKC